MSTFNLPDLGEGLPDAEIVEWHVKVGDTVKLDAPLVSMETAKAIVEVPSPQTGCITQLFGKAGDVIPTGNPLVTFDVEAVPRASATVAGELEEDDTILTETALNVSTTAAASNRIRVTPATRALAKKLGVDLDTVQATGPNNTVTKDDVENAQGASEGFEALKGVRRSMASIMTAAHAQVVPASVVDDVDVSGWIEGGDITVRLIQAVTIACKKEPALNALYEPRTPSRQCQKNVNLGLALDNKEGLFVPVIHKADTLDAKALRAEIESLKVAVASRNIPAEKLKGNSITLSNFGKFAGRYAAPVVVPPTVAIIAVGKLYEAPMIVKGEWEMRKMLPLSLTFDHRAATGGEATRFMHALIESLR